MSDGGTYGIFPPLEWETDAPLAWSFSMFAREGLGSGLGTKRMGVEAWSWHLKETRIYPRFAAAFKMGG